MTVPLTTTDVISELAGVAPGSELAELRAQRPEAMQHAQGSYAALFETPQPSDLTGAERLAIAAHVAGLHHASQAQRHYLGRLGHEQPVGARWTALLRHADLLSLRPVTATPDDLQALVDAGLSATAILTLSQVIAFVSFQVRVVAGLCLLGDAHQDDELHTEPALPEVPTAAEAPGRVVRPPADLRRPTAFTVAELAWTPWLEPIELANATPEQAAALDDRRGNSPYFRLLARDPRVLVERTATDRGIFYTHGGAPRAERELAAAATSRLNGCIYCTSVHARLAAQLSKRDADVDRLLRRGVAPGTPLELDDRWQAVVHLAVALAPTPPALSPAHVQQLRDLGASDLEILDVIQAGAFFAWANRLMLTLGEPYVPEPILRGACHPKDDNRQGRRI
ncbi:MAG TPA: alkylhydroperoxidase domain protein [Chloroflexota bacterium]